MWPSQKKGKVGISKETEPWDDDRDKASSFGPGFEQDWSVCASLPGPRTGRAGLSSWQKATVWPVELQDPEEGNEMALGFVRVPDLGEGWS